MTATVTPAEVAKLLKPFHNTGEIGGLVALAELLVEKINGETIDVTDLTGRVEDLETFQAAAESDISDLEDHQAIAEAAFTEIDTWSDTLAAKLNADAANTELNDTDYAGVDLSD